ncbi:MAG: fused MFS/spermidine synthase [Desulfobacterota bacterium]|nr:fused MFS/spermidine synthase [Thermodesulfobacteriota bacterium]MDW8002836.1 fused MFS/spermidine synthase [Deltaproteobacteria bacterium]
MERLIRVSALFMGVSGTVAEIILVREFLIVFSGNELYMGIVLSNWLILEGIGSLLSPRIIKRQEKLLGFCLTNLLFCIALCLSIFFVRALKPFLGISVGEMIGLFPSFFASLILLSFVSGLHGVLFPYTCEIYGLYTGVKEATAGRIYAYETLGTVIGGIVVTYLFIPYFDSFRTVFFVSFLNGILCLFFIWKIKGFSFSFAFFAVFICAFLVFTFFSNRVHWYSIRYQWPNQKVVHYENSKYGNICVVENEGQYIFFQDGVPELFIPFPDMIAVEETVHIPLLSHPNPKRVLLIGIGGGGPIKEILKHPTVNEITYAELDPLLIKLLKQYKTELTEEELKNPKVRIRHEDGRFYLNSTSAKYDVIIVGIRTPSTLEANRFFTREFFELAKGRMNEDGIFVAGIPFSLRYVNEELIQLTRTVFFTLRSTYRYVKPKPGEGAYLFLCSDSYEVLKLDSATCQKRIEERGIRTEVRIPWYIEQKLHKGWEGWFQRLIGENVSIINSDLHPVVTYNTILYLQSIYNPGLAKFFRELRLVTFETVILVISVFFFLYLFLFGFRKEKFLGLCGVPILTSGFYGMVIELLILFSFQSVFGYVFSWMGLLVSAYMAGSAIGAYLLSREKIKVKFASRLFLLAELALICFSFLYPSIIDYARTQFPQHLLKSLFLVLSFLGGLCVGLEFPLANLIWIYEKKDATKIAGLLYALDLLGGFIAGLIAPFWFVPLFGIPKTSYLLSVLKLASMGLFVIEFILKGEKHEG